MPDESILGRGVSLLITNATPTRPNTLHLEEPEKTLTTLWHLDTAQDLRSNPGCPAPVRDGGRRSILLSLSHRSRPEAGIYEAGQCLAMGAVCHLGSLILAVSRQARDKLEPPLLHHLPFCNCDTEAAFWTRCLSVLQALEMLSL